MDTTVTDATVSNAAEGVFVNVEPATRVASPNTPTPDPAPSPAPAAPGFTEADLAAVRKQEKDKLYPQIEQLKNELGELKREREERLEAERKAQEEAERLAKQQQEDEMDVRSLLAQKEREWEERLERERIERENAIALLEKEKAYAEISDYRSQRLAEVGDEIMPQLRDMVTGNTKEEIDQSIAGLIAKSNAILEEAQSAMQAQRQQMQGPRVTAPATELDTNSGQRQFTPEEIADMSMAEYQKYRSSLLGQTGSGTNRGLFG